MIVGELSLWLALLMAVWSAVGSFAGLRSGRYELIVSGERAVFASFALLVLASAGLCAALLTSDFSLWFVASHTTSNLPLLYKLAAFWSGGSGSLLLWGLLLSAVCTVAVITNRSAGRTVAPWTTGTLALVLAFVLLAAALAANPYTRVPVLSQEGSGLLPELQNPAMVLHPPLIYLGYVAATVPFALVIGALASRRYAPEWLRAVRMWSLASWLFLTLGIGIGMWWSYGVIGWGGVWAWDPVENAALLPWLTTTAFLHAGTVQAKLGLLRKWNILLVVATFFLAIFCAFVARSGALPSTHAFVLSDVGNWVGWFSLIAIGATGWLFASRLEDLQPAMRFETLRSREAALAAASAVLAGLALALLAATMFPLVVARLMGSPPERVADFDAVIVPCGVLLLVLMVVGHALKWHRASAPGMGARRYGGHIVHAGVVVLCVGLLGGTYRREQSLALTAGQTYATHDPWGHEWAFMSMGVSNDEQMNRLVRFVAVRPLRDGKTQPFIRSELRQHVNTFGDATFDALTEPGILRTLREDVYVVFTGVEPDGSATLRIAFQPLVVWIWIGAGLMALGALVALVTAGREETLAQPDVRGRGEAHP